MSRGPSDRLRRMARGFHALALCCDRIAVAFDELEAQLDGVRAGRVEEGGAFQGAPIPPWGSSHGGRA